MRLEEATLSVLDFESTGVVAGFPVEPWQVGVVKLCAGRIDQNSLWESLIQVEPERPFNPHAPGRHAQLRDQLTVAPTRDDLFRVLQEKISGNARVAHNCATEHKMLRLMAPMHPFGPWIDTLKLAREAWPGLSSYALEELIVSLQLSSRIDALVPERAAHDALYDAVAAAVLLERLCEEGWGALPLSQLVS